MLLTKVLITASLFGSSLHNIDINSSSQTTINYQKLSKDHSASQPSILSYSIKRDIDNCSCKNEANSSFLSNAQIMRHQIQNKTTILSKIRHRATHSNEAVWASFTLSGLMILLVVGVLHSKMWNDRTYLSYPESQPVRYEQFSTKSEIKVKEVIRSRGRSLSTMFREPTRKLPSNTLQMEAFIVKHGDSVDSSHQALLEESSDEFICDSESDSGEDTIFAINRRTGQWDSLVPGESEETRMSLLGKRESRRSRSTSSSDSRCNSTSFMNTSAVRDLIRLSDSDRDEVDEKTNLIEVG